MRVVEYYKEMKYEEPFTLGGIKWVYCWGKYPDGKIDIAVYRFSHDLAYDYSDFREAMGIDKPTQKNINENMENTINEKIMKLKATQEELDKRLAEFQESIAELEAVKEQLVPEVLEAFKGQTEGAEKLKVDVDGLLVEIVQAHEKKTVSYKVMSELVMEELAKLDIALGKTAQQLQEDSKVAQKVKGQLKIGGLKVYEGEADEFSGKVVNWLGRSGEIKNKNIQSAEMSVDAIEDMINKYEEEEANKYATPNMDDVESGAVREEGEVHMNMDMRNITDKMGLEYYVNKDKTSRTLETKKSASGEDYYVVTDKKEGYEYWFEILDDTGDKVKFAQNLELNRAMEETYEMEEGAEEKEEEVKEEGSWMETRAGANGEVFEMDEKLHEAINRYKKIINY